MPEAPTVRPLRPDDARAAERVFWAAIGSAVLPELVPEDDVRHERGWPRYAHLIESDPGGAWGAELGGELVGVALALLREGLWGLSAFGVHPDHQRRGVGTALLAPAVAYGEGSRGGIILSSEHPAAMRRYLTAGFAVRPCLSASGALNASRIPDGLRSRPGDAEADRPVIDRASRHVRGATHALDVPWLLAAGGRLLVCEDRGFAVERDGCPTLVAAVDEDAARDLLWSVFAIARPGATVEVGFVTQGNDWALDVALRAGLALSPDGPVFTRGAVGPLRPFLPSGSYL